jgi:uncharacterized membrane protein YedE/YeeE
MLTAALGGVLIGGSAGLLMLARGRVAGIGGMVGGLVAPRRSDDADRLAFLAGLVFAGVFAAALHARTLASVQVPLFAVAVGGLLVGWGVQRGRGCTSGHGVCGLARFSARSLVATLTFMATGALTVLLTHHLWGPR